MPWIKCSERTPGEKYGCYLCSFPPTELSIRRDSLEYWENGWTCSFWLPVSEPDYWYEIK